MKKPDEKDSTTQNVQPIGMGTEISAIFREHGLRDGEEIPELRGYPASPPDLTVDDPTRSTEDSGYVKASGRTDLF